MATLDIVDIEGDTLTAAEVAAIRNNLTQKKE
jgi:hypothetical protein